MCQKVFGMVCVEECLKMCVLRGCLRICVEGYLRMCVLEDV